MTDPSGYARGWWDGYGQGRDDEAAALPIPGGPPAEQDEETQRGTRAQHVPRDRQLYSRRNR
ncbi:MULTISPECIES: hypothetical protein [Protofrankia]|uniref:Uncharacterized protein n=1 Tax=Protofrankia coriariae TaxID=1562887 RepID=A0ABR5F4H1_9ACTN|nr:MULTISPECIES: hypothetical protein [Protofrankia]KLL11572.1 hypothetical protein FrCorBMG51_11085 [Protofrankia coriariae]ONH35707.1 hypothetical protein BL254_10480 [Protofrankia sp. BMG5.30]